MSWKVRSYSVQHSPFPPDGCTELYVNVPTLGGNIRLNVEPLLPYYTLLARVHLTVGCTGLKTKPTLSAQTGSAVRPKDTKFVLNLEDTWRVIVDDALEKYKLATAGSGQKAKLARSSRPQVHIVLQDDVRMLAVSSQKC